MDIVSAVGSGKPHCLIIGCGDIGTRLGLLLVEAGWQVTGVRRQADVLPTSFVRLSADVFALETELDALPPVDVVVYSVTPSDGRADSYQRAYVDGVACALAAMRKHHSTGHLPKLWLHFSSSRAWSVDDGSWVDESTVSPAKDAQTQSLLDGEQLVAESGIPYTITRFSGIYGKSPEAVERMVNRWGNYDAASMAWTNRIHADDAAGFCAYLLATWQNGASLSPLYAVSDNQPLTQSALLTWTKSGAVSAGLDLVTAEQAKRIRNQRLRDTGYQLRYPSVFDALTLN